MSIRRELHEANRLSWNQATRAHNAHKRDQASFFRAGGSTLFPEELALLGEVAGKRLAHLQCNSGQDSLSLAARGALVTGVDISDEAIAFATELSAQSGIPAEFVRADVMDWLTSQRGEPGRFDLVFCSYGVAGWLSDLAPWARGIRELLAANGRFVYVEFHPLIWSLDSDFRLTKDPYFAAGRVFDEPVGDYVERSGPLLAPSGYVESEQPFANPYPAHSFQWTLGDLVTALGSADLLIERLEEYPFLNGARSIANLVEKEGRRLYPPADVAAVPLMFGLRARAAAPA
jgi:SAM-dependent methyltransferase